MKETKFKQTDIGLIPKDWDCVSLSSIIDCCCYGVGAEAVKFDGKIKYLRITDIDDENHKFMPKPLASPSFYNSLYFAKKGDLFVARTGASVGKSYLYDENDGMLVFAGFLIKVHISSANPYYVFLNTLTDQYKSWVLSESARTGQPGINAQQLQSLCIPIPPTLEEQERIANALSQMDDLIATLDEQIEKKKLIKQGAMQQLLTGKTRLKGFNGKWKTVKLGDIGTVIRGVSFKPEQSYSTYKKDCICLLRSNNIFDGKINYDDVLYVDVECVNDCQIMKRDDLLICAANGSRKLVGKSGRKIDDKVVTFGAFMCVFRCENIEDASFVCHVLQSDSYGKQLDEILAGSAINNLNGKMLENMLFLFPPTFAEQQAIASALSAMDDEIQALQEERDKYVLIKQGMMQQLLTGKIRLQ